MNRTHQNYNQIQQNNIILEQGKCVKTNNMLCVCKQTIN